MTLLRKSGIATSVIVFASQALAHTADEAAEAGANTWSFEPGVVIPLLLLAALFVTGAVRRWNRPDWSNAEVGYFAAGWLTLVLALVSPVHKLGAVLFSVHMTQHELLMIVAAPLLVLSRPLLWMIWALPLRWRETFGRVARQPQVAAVWLAVTSPLFAWLLHGSTLWAWHIPSLYQASIEHEWVHSLQHITFLSTALLFWWTLIHGRQKRFGYGLALVLCFTTALHTSILGALMTFARQVWYPIYNGRTAAFELTPIEDQQLGGLIMWVPAGIVYIALGLWIMGAWIKHSERRVRFTEAEQVSNGDRYA